MRILATATWRRWSCRCSRRSRTSPSAAGSTSPPQPASPSGARIVRGRTGHAVELPVFTLLDQPCGAQGAGPAVVEGPFFTMRLPEGWQFQITAAGDLLLADTLPHRYTGSH